MVNMTSSIIIGILLAIAIIAFGLPLLMKLKPSSAETFINTRPELEFVDAPYRYFLADSNNFINFNLEEVPPVNTSPFPQTLYWQYYEIPERVIQYENCDQYGCSTVVNNGGNAEPNESILNPKDSTVDDEVIEQFNLGQPCGYYENPVMYCNKNPTSEVCPNNWLTSGEKTDGPIMD